MVDRGGGVLAGMAAGLKLGRRGIRVGSGWGMGGWLTRVPAQVRKQVGCRNRSQPVSRPAESSFGTT